MDMESGFVVQAVILSELQIILSHFSKYKAFEFPFHLPQSCFVIIFVLSIDLGWIHMKFLYFILNEFLRNL